MSSFILLGYKDNFEIVYDNDKSQWILNVKSALAEDAFNDNSDLILTLTATDTGNSKIGQAALVLHLPSDETKLAPKFSHPFYTANYVVEDNKDKIVLNEEITVVNKDSNKLDITLDCKYKLIFL